MRLKKILRLLVSHHIDCGHFEDHVLHIGPFRICAGCTFFSIGLFLSFFSLGLLFSLIENSYVWFLFGGLLLWVCYFISVYKYEKWYNRLGKFLAGFGFFFYFLGGASTIFMPLVVISLPIAMVIYSKKLHNNHKKICMDCNECTR